MKYAWFFVPLLCLVSTGCVIDAFVSDKMRNEQQQVKPLPAPSAPAPAPITADQVTPENAHQLATGLWDEMDRDAQKPPPPATPPTPLKHKH